MRLQDPTHRLLLAAVLFLSLTTAGYGQENPHPAAEDSRYEGYEFLDTAGTPLPNQSDRSIEELLATSKIVSMSNIPAGVTHPRKLLLAKDGYRVNAIFKDIDETNDRLRFTLTGKERSIFRFRDWHGYDIAAYQLDRLLGLDRVPPIISRTIRRRRGSVQIWLEEVISRTKMRDDAIEAPDIARWNQQKSILHIFGSLVANIDSNTGNALIDGNWRMWFIDCSRCFNTSKELYYLDGITHCERHLWRALQNLNPEEAHRRLAPYLNRAQIDAVLDRRDLIVNHLQGLMDESGEGAVLFDLQPPSKMAVWAGNR